MDSISLRSVRFLRFGFQMQTEKEVAIVARRISIIAAPFGDTRVAELLVVVMESFAILLYSKNFLNLNIFREVHKSVMI